MDLTSGEAIEFAKLNAGVVQPSKMVLTLIILDQKMLFTYDGKSVHRKYI
jgi:hypothetical protein